MIILQEIFMSQETVNDEYVTVVKLYYLNNDFVKSGDTVIDVETSKAIFSIEAESDGYIRYYCKEGDDVEIGKLVVRIFDTVYEETISDSEEKTIPGDKELNERAPEPEFSKSALEYIKKTNLDKSLFIGMDMVTYKDVLEMSQKTERLRENDYITFDISHETERTTGKLDHDSFAQLQKDADRIALLDSESKILRYKEFGAMIGKNVVLGRGSIIIAKQIKIEDGVVLEDNCIIRCESLHLGELGFYRSGLDCNCKSISIGKEAFVARNVIIGRGGSGEPTAILKIGDRVFLGERCLLNTCMPITIGDECFIGQNSAIMTHNIGLSYLEGYENAFAPVRIGNGVQIGINCVLYPNSEIEEGSVVASNSYVIGKIPEGKLVMGIPAKIVKDSHKKVTLEERRRRFSQLIKRFIALLKVRDIGVRVEIVSSGTLVSFDYAGTSGTILFCDRCDSKQILSLSKPLVVVALEGGDFESHEDTVIFDLRTLQVSGKPTPITEGLREFFRKAGIKLSPWPWRYRGGIL